MKHRTLKAVISNIAITLAVYLVLSFLLVMVIYEGLFARTDESAYRAFLSYDDMGDYACREITFDSDGFILSGRVYNDGGEAGTVILGHAKGCTGEDMLAEARFFADNGFAAMVFDLSGHGKSSGTSQRGLCKAVSDMKNAVLFCGGDEKLSGKPIYLYGAGMSGYAAALCSSMDAVRAAVTVSAFDSVPEMTLEYALSQMSVLGYLEYPVMLLYQFMIFGEELGRSASDAINSSDVPVMAIHGTADELVSISGASICAKRERITNPGFRAIQIEHGDHSSLTRSESAREYLEEFRNEANELKKQYNGSVPTFVIKEVYERYNREKMSEPDAGLMNEVLGFFLSANG